ncbi:MAG: hypothetical protein WBA45_03495 [Microthrixaceae bacterium]
MLKRSVYGVVVLVLLGSLAGCYTPPAPAPPSVDSVEISPQPAHPGDTVSVRIEASHNVEVYNVLPLALVNPQGSGVGVENCTSTIEHPGGDLTHATITINCALPALVSNGTWTLSYRPNYLPPTDYPFQSPPPPPSTVTFEVVGGSDDVSPPTLVSYHTSPEVVTRGTPFTVTARVRDDSPVFLGLWNAPNSKNITFSGSSYSNTCREATLTPVSATEADVVYSCDGSWIGLVGPLTGQVSGNLWVRDALYNNAELPLTIDFQPGG